MLLLLWSILTWQSWRWELWMQIGCWAWWFASVYMKCYAKGLIESPEKSVLILYLSRGAEGALRRTWIIWALLLDAQLFSGCILCRYNGERHFNLCGCWWSVFLWVIAFFLRQMYDVKEEGNSVEESHCSSVYKSCAVARGMLWAPPRGPRKLISVVPCTGIGTSLQVGARHSQTKAVALRPSCAYV